MQKLGENSKTPPAAIAFIVRLSEFLRELVMRKGGDSWTGGQSKISYRDGHPITLVGWSI